MVEISYRRHRFSPMIIQHAVERTVEGHLLPLVQVEYRSSSGGSRIPVVEQRLSWTVTPSPRRVEGDTVPGLQHDQEPRDGSYRRRDPGELANAQSL